jgi:hypothetical protein
VQSAVEDLRLINLLKASVNAYPPLWLGSGVDSGLASEKSDSARLTVVTSVSFSGSSTFTSCTLMYLALLLTFVD